VLIQLFSKCVEKVEDSADVISINEEFTDSMESDFE